MANNPQMLIRVAANIDELKRNLQEGKAQIETTTAAMQKMGASFSGDKLIQNAHNVVAAVNEIGGASNLTRAEMDRVNATLDRAIAKYAALGKQVPPAMLELAEATKKIEPPAQSADKAFNLLKGTLGSLGLGLSIGTVTAFIGSLVKMGDEIVRVADRTGLTTTEVQKLQYIAGQSGNSIDELTGAVGLMQKRMDDPAFEQALGKIGVNFDQLRAADPYEQLQLISAGFQKIKDPAIQAQIAADLFGKSGISILPTIRANMKALGDEAPVMADRTVRALDSIGDAFARAKAVMITRTADAFITPFMDAADEGRALIGVLDILRGKVETMPKIGEAFKFSPMAMPKSFTMAEMKDQQNETEKFAETLRKQAAAAREAHQAAVQMMADAFSGAAAIKAADFAMEAYNSNLARGKTVTQMSREQQDALNKILLAAINAYQSAGRIVPQSIQSAYDATVNWAGATKGLAAEYDKLDKILDKVRPKTLETITTMDGATTSLNGRFKELDAALDKIAKGPKLTPLAQSADDAVKAVALLQHSLGDDLTKTLLSLPDILTRAFEGGGGIGGAMKSLAIRFGQDFGKEMSAAIAQQLKAGGSSMSGSSIGAAGGMGILAVGTTAASGGSTGQQLGAAVSSGMSAASMASMAGATTAASIAFAAYTAGAGLAVIAAIKIYKAMNDGRKAMQDFYKTFQGGADELRTRMLILGDVGEAMWQKLTQQTGKGDKQGAQKITAEIMKALTEAEGIQAAISAAGFKSQDELKATADAAMKVWQTMKDSGKYSADQVAAAWEMAQEAIRVSLGKTATTQTEANTKALAAIKAMDDEMKSLSDSIAGEAPEEFMGVVERQTRDRIAAIAAQRDAAQKELDQTTTDAAAAAKEAGDVIDAALAAREYHVRVKVDLEGLPGGDVPIYTTRSGGSSGGGLSVSLQPQPIYLDGREIARNQAQHLPSVLSGMGL